MRGRVWWVKETTVGRHLSFKLLSTATARHFAICLAFPTTTWQILCETTKILFFTVLSATNISVSNTYTYIFFWALSKILICTTINTCYNVFFFCLSVSCSHLLYVIIMIKINTKINVTNTYITMILWGMEPTNI